MGVVWAFAVHTPKHGVFAWSAAYSPGSGVTGVITCRVWGGAPPARGWIGAFGIVVSVAVAVGKLGVRVETQSALGSIGGRGGSQAFPDIVRGPGTSNGDHNCGGRFSSSSVVGSKPSGLAGEGQSSVESASAKKSSCTPFLPAHPVRRTFQALIT